MTVLVTGVTGLVGARLVVQLTGRLVVVLHALLEALDRFAQVLAGIAQALGAEDEQHDHQHDDPMPDAQTAHGVLAGKLGRSG